MPALLLALALVATACGGDGGTTAEPEDTDEPTATEPAGETETSTEAIDTSDIEELELQMASFLSPGTAQGVAISWWIEELAARTDGKVTVQTFWNAELLGAQEIKDGLRDGRVQLGNMTYAYTPSDFPLTQIVEVPFLGNNVPAQATALNQLYANNEDFRNEWENQGIKVMSFVGIPAALTGAKEPVTTVDWYRGKTVRASGFFVKALEAVGSNAAAIPVTDVYEAMQRGTIDAYGGLILDVITPLSLHEVGPHVHDAGLGHYANSTWTMALDTWNSLSPGLQAIIEDLNAEFPAVLTDAYSETEDAACTVILDSGGSVHIFSEEETQKWADAIGDTPLQTWVDLADGAGADGAPMYDEFKGYFDAAASGEFADYESGIARCVAQQG
jgi:TRAP-type transport system periplasmic protein